MKTQGFERRFSQNLAPVGARKAPKPLLCLHFKFIQQTRIREDKKGQPKRKTNHRYGEIGFSGYHIDFKELKRYRAGENR